MNVFFCGQKRIPKFFPRYVRRFIILSYLHLKVGTVAECRRILSWDHGEPILKQRKKAAKKSAKAQKEKSSKTYIFSTVDITAKLLAFFFPVHTKTFSTQ